MTFSKEEYWKNRRAGIRGQGDDLTQQGFTESKTSHFIQVATRLVPTNRATARRKVVDHKLTTKGHRLTDDKQALAIRERVRRTEKGEQQRIATKKALALETQ